MLHNLFHHIQGTQQTGSTYPSRIIAWRWLAAHLPAMLPARIVTDHGGLAQAEALLQEGYGLLVLMNHFSKRDGLQVLQLLFGSDVLRRRPTLAPVASHLVNPLVRFLAGRTGVQLAPVTTQEAVDNLGLDAEPVQSALAYTQQAVATLQAGGVVLLAPQAGRRPSLGRPQMRPVSLLLAQARRKRVARVALLCVGLRMPGVDDYALEKVGGLNLLQPYELSIGRAVTYEEAVAQAGGHKQLDTWVYASLEPLVAPAYVGNRGLS